MKRTTQILKASDLKGLSKSSKEKIHQIAEDIKGKELFTTKIEMAKQNLSKVRSLPI